MGKGRQRGPERERETEGDRLRQTSKQTGMDRQTHILTDEDKVKLVIWRDQKEK